MTRGATGVARGRRHDELVTLAQHDQDTTGLDESTSTFDDQLEHAVQIGQTTDGVGNATRQSQ